LNLQALVVVILRSIPFKIKGTTRSRSRSRNRGAEQHKEKEKEKEKENQKKMDDKKREEDGADDELFKIARITFVGLCHDVLLASYMIQYDDASSKIFKILKDQARDLKSSGMKLDVFVHL
jgi:hypothetical protein